MNIPKTVFSIFQLILSFSVIIMVAANETIQLIFSESETSLIATSIFLTSICILFVMNENVRKTNRGFPGYRNPPPPPPKISQKTAGVRISDKSHTIPIFNSISLAECAAISMIKESEVKKLKYIYMASDGKVIVLSHEIGGIQPISIIKPE